MDLLKFGKFSEKRHFWYSQQCRRSRPEMVGWKAVLKISQKTNIKTWRDGYYQTVFHQKYLFEYFVYFVSKFKGEVLWS